MRDEAAAYQIEHDGKDLSEQAMQGEIDCLVALSMLQSDSPKGS
jgi:hypothetical protein